MNRNASLIACRSKIRQRRLSRRPRGDEGECVTTMTGFQQSRRGRSEVAGSCRPRHPGSIQCSTYKTRQQLNDLLKIQGDDGVGHYRDRLPLIVCVQHPQGVATDQQLSQSGSCARHSTFNLSMDVLY